MSRTDSNQTHDVRFVEVPGETPTCSRCCRPTRPLGDLPADIRFMVDGQFVCFSCLTEAEQRVHCVNLIDGLNEELHKLAQQKPVPPEFSDILERIETLELHLEAMDNSNDPATVRQFIADVESGVELAESKGEAYEFPDLIVKAQWARERLLLLDDEQGSS